MQCPKYITAITSSSTTTTTSVVCLFLFCLQSPWAHLHVVGMLRLCLCRKPTEIAHSFSFCSVSISVFMVLSTVFHSINSSDNSPLCFSVFPVFFLALLVFSTMYLFTNVSHSSDLILCDSLGLKHQLTNFASSQK